jgi:hypothetical protein
MSKKTSSYFCRTLPFASVYCNASLPVPVVINDLCAKTWAFEGAEQLLTHLAAFIL